MSFKPTATLLLILILITYWFYNFIIIIIIIEIKLIQVIKHGLMESGGHTLKTRFFYFVFCFSDFYYFFLIESCRLVVEIRNLNWNKQKFKNNIIKYILCKKIKNYQIKQKQKFVDLKLIALSYIWIFSIIAASSIQYSSKEKKSVYRIFNNLIQFRISASNFFCLISLFSLSKT